MPKKNTHPSFGKEEGLRTARAAEGDLGRTKRAREHAFLLTMRKPTRQVAKLCEQRHPIEALAFGEAIHRLRWHTTEREDAFVVLAPSRRKAGHAFVAERAEPANERCVLPTETPKLGGTSRSERAR